MYDTTHGLGLAILTTRWMEYIIDENTAPKFYQFGVNVLGIDKDLPAMEEMYHEGKIRAIGVSNPK